MCKSGRPLLALYMESLQMADNEAMAVWAGSKHEPAYRAVTLTVVCVSLSWSLGFAPFFSRGFCGNMLRVTSGNHTEVILWVPCVDGHQFPRNRRWHPIKP